MKTLINGDIVFPNRGRAPQEPEGYYRDKGDPFLFHPIIVTCKHRKIESSVLPCGKVKCNWFCDYKGEVVDQRICLECTIEPKE